MLVELGLVEQRYRRCSRCSTTGRRSPMWLAAIGVARQTVHRWLRQYAAEGLGGLVDRVVEAVVVSASDGRRWSRRGSWRCAGSIRGGVRARSGIWLEREGVEPVPGRTSIYRCLVRHGLITPGGPEAQAGGLQALGTRPGDGAVADGHRRRGPSRRWVSEAKIVSGIDDHSRFVVSARGRGAGDGAAGVRRAGARDATHGVPEQILTDNGKVFTGRFGPGTGEVLFDRICRENGITHLLTAPRSPTTTGKVERWHKTLRREFLDRQGLRVDRRRAGAARRVGAQLQPRTTPSGHRDGRRSNGSGSPRPRETGHRSIVEPARAPAAPVTTRRVSANGHDQLRRPRLSRPGRGSPARPSRSSATAAWSSSITAACSSPPTPAATTTDKQTAALRRGRRPPRPTPRPSTSAASVTRKVDTSGNVSFAATNYRVGNKFRRRQVQVAVVGDTIEISIGERTHPRPPHPPRPHPRTRRPRQPRRPTPPHQRRLTRTDCQHSYRGRTVSTGTGA